MTIVRPEIPLPDPAVYTFDDPGTGSPLHNPSHAGLHTKINTAVENLNARVSFAEESINDIWPEIQQSRLVVDTWLVPGTLDIDELYNKMMMPPIFNLTGRSVQFWAAKATVFTAPIGQSIQVQIWTGAEITGEGLEGEAATMMLKAPQGLVIPQGQFTSNNALMIAGDFIDQNFQAQNHWVSPVVTQVGTTNPGADLSIQINRLL